MSYVIPAYQYEDEQEVAAPTSLPALLFVPRSKLQWLGFVMPAVFCSISWVSGGIPALTDAGFLLFFLVAAAYLCVEFYRFPVRFGIGGLVLYGGTLCWFAHDYFTHWFRHDFNGLSTDIPPWVIAKTAALHCMFVMMMSIGLNISKGAWLSKILNSVPTPGDNRSYLFLVLLMFAIGISPFFLFNAEPFYLAIFHVLFSQWTGGAQLTVFRTGNLNYSWGAYVAQVMQVGQVGGIFAMLYALMISRSLAGKVFGVTIWLFWALVAFESDRRGEISFALLPPIALLFIKNQAKAAAAFRKFSLRAYVFCGMLAFGLLFVVQFQGTFRGVGFAKADLSRLDLTVNQGNTMFSEGLPGFRLVPDTKPYFRATIPGEQWVRPIPQAAFDFAIGIIPRALWNSKPIDGMWKWYNEIITGNLDGTVGTTISHGLVGSWYFAYGFGGIVEGGLLVGWLMGSSERALQNSGGQPIGILMSLAFATWLFRVFRDFIYIDLYGLVIGGIVLAILVKFTRPFLSGAPASSPPST